MQNIYYKLAKVESGLESRSTWQPSLTKQQRFEYDQKLSMEIKKLENMVHDYMEEVSTTTQVEWLESVLQTVGQFKERLASDRWHAARW